tara:strand:- start:865 stop:1110 length:246 start_codon:yes stop_codon:yes gene_type:complete
MKAMVSIGIDGIHGVAKSTGEHQAKEVETAHLFERWSSTLQFMTTSSLFSDNAGFECGCSGAEQNDQRAQHENSCPCRNAC